MIVNVPLCTRNFTDISRAGCSSYVHEVFTVSTFDSEPPESRSSWGLLADLQQRNALICWDKKTPNKPMYLYCCINAYKNTFNSRAMTLGCNSTRKTVLILNCRDIHYFLSQDCTSRAHSMAELLEKKINFSLFRLNWRKIFKSQAKFIIKEGNFFLTTVRAFGVFFSFFFFFLRTTSSRDLMNFMILKK